MKPGIAVIGAGKFGRLHLDVIRQLERQGLARLCCAAVGRREHVDALHREYQISVYTDYVEALEHPGVDAVTVATPDHLHRAVTLDALHRGRHVLVEKPMDTDPAGCELIVEMAERTGLLVQVDFHKRYDPDHRKIAERVRQGDLGEVLYGYVHMEDRIEVPTRWFPHWASQSSPVWFLGVHFYDLIRWILGQEARSVNAHGSRRFLKSEYALDTLDHATATVTFDGGAVVTFQTSWVIPDGFEAIVNQGLRLVGSRGLIECDSQDRGMRSCIAHEGMRTYNNNFRHEVVSSDGVVELRGYGVESIADFIHNVRSVMQGRSPASLKGCLATAVDGLEATRIAAAVHQSIETGKPVRIRRN